MNAWVDALNAISATWLELLLRASWQGGIALAVVWLIARFVSRLPAAHKVWLWRLAFLKLLAGLVWLSPVVLPVLPQQTPEVQVAETIPTAVEHTEAADSLPLLAMTIEPTDPSLHFRGWLFLAWCAALFICALRVLRHWRETRRLLRGSRSLGNETAEKCIRALSERLRLWRAPLISESPDVSSPVLVGIFRPQIILPRGLADSVSPSRLELMLAHELAHLRRRDLLWLWLFILGEALFFFHPLVWLARREWTLATEAACDEMAIRFTRQTPRAYGEMLVDIVAATSRRGNAAPLVTVGIIENAHTLKRRLKLMITTRTRFASVGGIALIAVATFALVPWKLTAQDADAEAVAKLKEDNAKLRKELEAIRKDAEKMRSDAEHLRKRAVEERENALLKEGRAEELKHRSARDARQFEQQRIMEKMQAELEQLRTRFTEEHPLVRQQQEEIEKMRADSERLQARRVAELENRARMIEQQKAMLKAQTKLDAARTKFPDEHPEVRRVEAELETLKAGMAAAKAESDFGSRTTPERVRASRRPTRHQEEQRALLQKEIALVERQVEMVRREVEAGVQSRSALLAVQRELLDVKLQLAGLSDNKDEARAVVQQQIDIANKMLKEHKQRVERGLAPVGSEIQLEREVLRLTRKLHERETDSGH